MAACAIERISPTALKIVLVQLQSFTEAKISGSGLFVFVLATTKFFGLAPDVGNVRLWHKADPSLRRTCPLSGVKRTSFKETRTSQNVR